MADHLLARGHEVAVVDELSSGRHENVPDGATFYEAGVRFGCPGVFEEFESEVLSHQAAQMDVRRSVREPDFDADVNVLGTLRLLENCVKHAVRKGSSSPRLEGRSMGSRKSSRATEDHPQYPSSPYGVSKLAAERYLHFYSV